jgi:L-ascorbate metabolism protein UlaG (beta-lactamase superfamily)
MYVRWLGWAGMELESDGATIAVDPVVNAAGGFAAPGDAARQAESPTVHTPAAGCAAALTDGTFVGIEDSYAFTPEEAPVEHARAIEDFCA